VAFHHGYTWTSTKTRLYNQLDRWSLRGAHQVLTVSVPFLEELVAKGVRRERIEIVHNAIAPEWGTSTPEARAALRAKLGIGLDRKVILMVARLSFEKDHLTLLEAIDRLSPSLSPHLLIVGEGPELPSIEQRIRALNLSGKVTLTGQQDSAEPYYGIADVAVLSSRSEGSPNALLEAMAAGVPVVATRVGGIPEMVTDNESALLVKPGDVSAMTDAIARLLEDSQLAARLTQRSRELIRDRHAPDARMRKLVGIYLRCKPAL
jgi:glycosyltransferase involved in cell wall biosynthesis